MDAKKILITTEEHETIILRVIESGPNAGFCPACGNVVEMVPFDEAIRSSGLSGIELIREAAGGAIHYTETAEARSFICKQSLLGLRPAATSMSERRGKGSF
jgi:hypothetical protein